MVGVYVGPDPYAGFGAGGYGGDDDGRLLGDGEPPRLRLAEFLRQTVERINQMVAELGRSGVAEEVAAEVERAWTEHRAAAEQAASRLLGALPGPNDADFAAYGLGGASLTAKLSAFARARRRWDAFREAVTGRVKRIYGRALRQAAAPVIDSLKTAVGEVPGLTTTLEVVKEMLDLLNVVVDEVEIA